MDTVGAYEAKTHFSKLRARVAKGEKIFIQKHGVTVAVLQPPEKETRPPIEETIEKIQQLRKGQKLGDDLTIKDLIEDGRRY